MQGHLWGADARQVDSGNLPILVPVLFAYVTGTPDIRWLPERLAAFSHSLIVRIDQGFGTTGPLTYDELDVETGAWDFVSAAEQVRLRSDHGWSTRIYLSADGKTEMSQAIAMVAPDARVWYRLADWNLDEAEAVTELTGDVYAVQWASPSSNPDTELPGTGLTLTEAGADLNVVRAFYTN